MDIDPEVLRDENVTAALRDHVLVREAYKVSALVGALSFVFGAAAAFLLKSEIVIILAVVTVVVSIVAWPVTAWRYSVAWKRPYLQGRAYIGIWLICAFVSSAFGVPIWLYAGLYLL